MCTQHKQLNFNYPLAPAYGLWNQIASYWCEGMLMRINLFAHQFETIAIVIDDRYESPLKQLEPFFKQHLNCKDIVWLHLSQDSDNMAYLTPQVTLNQRPSLLMIPPLLHNYFDWPGIFIQANALLANHGLLISCQFTDHTLIELKTAMARLDEVFYQGVYQRFTPLVRSQDSAPLLVRSHFTDVVSDVESHPHKVAEIMALFKQLKDSHFVLNSDSTKDDKALTARYLKALSSMLLPPQKEKAQLAPKKYFEVSLDLCYSLGVKKPKDAPLRLSA